MKKSKYKYFPLLFLVVLILIFLNLLIFLNRAVSRYQSKGIKQITPIPTLSPQSTTDTVDWQTYIDSEYDYQIKWPKTWIPIEHSSNFNYINQYQAPDNSYVQIMADTQSSPETLNQYLANLDQQSAMGFEGKASKDIISSKPVKIGEYSGVEREETILAAGKKTLVTYLFTGETVFSFTVFGKDENYKDSQAYQYYNLILSTFKFTN